MSSLGGYSRGHDALLAGSCPSVSNPGELSAGDEEAEISTR